MMSSLYLTGRLFLVSAVVLVTGLALDELGLKSDPRSLLMLSILLLGAAAVFALVAGGMTSALLILAKRREWIDRLATAAPIAVSVGGAATILGQPVLRKFDMGWALPWVWLAATALYYLVAGRKTGPGPVLNRIGAITFCASLILVPAFMVGRFSPGPDADQIATPPAGKSGVLLLIVDALGAEFISGLNDGSPVRTPNFDSLLERSTTFPNAHATVPNTHGAFRALYTGQVLEQRDVATPNLIGDLQRAGVNVRIVATHMNAFPDNKLIRYRGLRSLLLTQNYSWIPRLAGVDYHLMPYLRAARAKEVKGMKSDRLEVLRRFLNSWQEPVDPFIVAEDELDRVTADERPFLFILHLFFNDTMATLPKPQTITALHPDRTDEERATTNQAIRDRSYRFTDEEAWWAEEYRAAYIDGVEDFDLALGEFIDSLSSKGVFEDLDLILMSDHGSSSQDNVLWYGYHTHEATTRIPLAVYREDEAPARDTRPSSTVDVTATIRDWFGVDGGGEGSSLLAEASGAPAWVFTRRDHEDVARVISYSRDRKDLFEVDLDLNVNWTESWEIGEDGAVTSRPATPADASAISARIEEFCLTRGCF